MAAAQGPLPPLQAVVPCAEAMALTHHKEAVLCATFNSDGGYVLLGSADKSVSLCNPWTGKVVKTYGGIHHNEIQDIACFPDNSKFVTVGGDKTGFLWDVPTGKVMRKFVGHTGRLQACLLFGEDRCDVVATASTDKTVRVWDLRAFAPRAMQTMADFSDSVMCLALHENTLMAGSLDGTLTSFDIRAGRQTVDRIGAAIGHMRLSSDGACVALACMDSTVRLVDRTSGMLLSTYGGHTHRGTKAQCALDPSDCYVLCTSECGAIFVWELASGRAVGKMSAHARACHALAFTPDKAKQFGMVTVSHDRSAKVWTMPQ